MKTRTTLRSITDDDHDFLRRVYRSTREAELAMTPWSDDEKDRFIQFQFHAQHTHYQEHFAQAAFDVIEWNGQPVGRLYVDRRADEIRLVDIALLPEFRGKGLGGELLGVLLDEGRRKDLPVRIHVEHNNPAMRLYQRLGFRQIEEQGVYHLMEWCPSGATPSRETPTRSQE